LGLSDNESANQSTSADLTDTLAGYVALVNREGLIEFAGQCEGSLTPDTLVGHKIFDRVPSEARQILIDKLGIAFETGGIEFIRVPAAECGNGGAIEIKLVPLHESGKPLRTVAVAFRRTMARTADGRLPAGSDGRSSRLSMEELPCERSLKERQLIEAMLRQSEERFRPVAEASPQGILIMQDRRIVFANQKAAQLLGAPVEVLVGAQLEDVICRHVDPDFRELLSEKHREWIGSTYEIKIPNATKGTRWVEITSIPVTFNGRDAEQVALTDITARKDAEEALRDSEERYRTLVENAQNAIFSMEYDGTLVFMNSVAGGMLGGEPRDFVGRNVHDLFPPDKAVRHLAAVQRVIDSGKGETIENLTELQGQARWHITSIHPVDGHKGRAKSAFMISTDITESKLAAQKLARERDFTHLILQTANSLIFCLDKDARILLFNKECERVTGYSSEEVLGKRWPDIFMPGRYRHDGLEDFGAWVYQHPADRREEPILTKSGEERIILWSNSSFVHPDTGEITAIAIGYDITEAKQVGQQLKETEFRFRNLIESIPALTYTAALDGTSTTTYISPQAGSLLGFTPGDYAANPDIWENQLHPDDRDRVLAEVQHCHRTGEPFLSEYRMIHRNGSIVWFRDHAIILRDESGRPLCLQGVQYDITESKAAEEKLRESEGRFKELADFLPQTVFEFGIDGKFTFVNRGGLELFGYTAEALEKGVDLLEALHPDDHERAWRNMISLGKGEQSKGNEYTAIRSDGTQFPALAYTTRICRNGEVVGYRGILIDITERKRNEVAVRLSEERFRALYRGSPLPTYTWQWNGADFVLIDYNEAACKITDDEIRSYLGFTANKLFENRSDCIQDIRMCYENGATINREMKYAYLSTGKTLELAVRYTFVPPDLVLVVTEDITQRKRDEEALRMSEERFRAIYNGSPLPMVLFQWKDGDLELVDYNKATDVAFFPRMPKLVGSTAKHLLAQEPEFLESLYECFHKQTAVALDYCHQMWNSDVRLYVSVFAAFIPPDLLLIQAQDISERKQMEEELHSTNELLAQERHALLDKNIALKEVLGQIKDEVNQVKQNMQSNIDKLILPILAKLKEKSRESDRIDLDLLESLMSDVSSPFLRDIESRFVQLTPRETEICNMIRNGLQSKEIGLALGISVRTVEKFRQKIRDKLCVGSRDTNLTTFLRSITQKH